MYIYFAGLVVSDNNNIHIEVYTEYVKIETFKFTH